jgi:flagellar protein FliT
MPDDGLTDLAPASGLLHLYESIARLSHDMVSASSADDWTRVGELEDQCRSLIATLKAAAAIRPLGRAEQRRRVELLREILAHDAQIRSRSEPWLRQLEHLYASLPRDSGS